MFKVNILPQLVKKVIDEILADVTDENLLSLHSVFEDHFEKALEYVDRARFTLFTLEDGSRSIIQIEGVSKQSYILYPQINYCTCPVFIHQVLANNRSYTCKHVISAMFALKVGKYEKRVISSQQMSNLSKLCMSVPDEITEEK